MKKNIVVALAKGTNLEELCQILIDEYQVRPEFIKVVYSTSRTGLTKPSREEYEAWVEGRRKFYAEHGRESGLDPKKTLPFNFANMLVSFSLETWRNMQIYNMELESYEFCGDESPAFGEEVPYDDAFMCKRISVNEIVNAQAFRENLVTEVITAVEERNKNAEIIEEMAKIVANKKMEYWNRDFTDEERNYLLNQLIDSWRPLVQIVN